MSAPALVPAVEPYRDTREVLRLVAAFEHRTLAKDAWTHAAHLTMGLWYTTHLPPGAALDAMRAGIHRLNAAHGVASTPSGGYHETITRAYLRLIREFDRGEPAGLAWHDRANRLVATLGDRDLLLRYYSRGRLMSREARAGWVEPDLRALP